MPATVAGDIDKDRQEQIPKDSCMLTAGVDIGSRFVKAAIVDPERGLVGRALVTTGFEPAEAAAQALALAKQQAGLAADASLPTAATGAGQREASFDAAVTDVAAAAAGARHLVADCRLVLDVGAESARAIKLDEAGRVANFALNEMCAAGAGSFVESMVRVLDASFGELDQWSLRSTGRAVITAQCAVFAESEVVSLLHKPTPREDIAKAIFESIAARTASLARRVGVAFPIAVVGGAAESQGFVAALKREFKSEAVFAPEAVRFAGAIGAALEARRRREG
ncbi:MAG: CoA activase [Myxococcales bacterium]|nr:MAG: CoA activase [Myxococcales bacterium]